jgi:hypothetical protein
MPYLINGFLVMNKRKRRASLSTSKETKGLLDSIKHTGQSYDGLIRELVMYWKNNNWKKNKVAEGEK